MEDRKFAIITDSACDLTAEFLNKIEVTFAKLSYSVDGVQYADEEEGVSVHNFYDKLRDGSISTTTQVNMGELTETFCGYLEKGTDVLYLSFSSALSGSYNAACVAAEEAEKGYPQGKVYAVDTKCASMGEGLLVYLCTLEKMKNKSLEEVRDFAEDIKLRICHYFTVEDLHFLHRGGRVSKVSAVVGTALGIKPVLHVNDLGELIPIGKVRGRKSSLDALVKNMDREALERENPVVFISHGDCIEDAEYVADMVREKFPGASITINYVGPVIGSHSGPGTVALFFIGSKR